MLKKTQERSKTSAVSRKEPVIQRKPSSASRSPDSTTEQLPYLQRSVGNLATQRLFQSGQLSISEPGDVYEQEADRAADAVMRIPEPPVQHQSIAPEDNQVQPKPGADRALPLMQREGEQKITAKEIVQPEGDTAQVHELDHSLAARMQSLKGSGHPLAETARAFMEPRFGYDFGGVRIHTGGEADAMNRALHSLAFTSGNDIFFRESQYQPETSSGRHLLAHELTHVVQQAGGSAALKGSAATHEQASRPELGQGLQAQPVLPPGTNERKPLLSTQQMQSVRVRTQEQAFLGKNHAACSILHLQREVGNQAEVSTRYGKRQQRLAGSPQALVDACQHRTLTYVTVLTSLKANTANAGRRALLNFANFSDIRGPTGIRVVDLFAVVLQALPYAAPIAKLIAGNLVRSAALAMLREVTVRTLTRTEGIIRGGSTVESAEGRAEFIASHASDFDEMERAMGEDINAASDKYGRAIEAARSDQSGLFAIYTELENLIKENQGLTRPYFDLIADLFELRLYKEFYTPKVHILIYESPMWGGHSANIVDMPVPVEDRITRLRRGAALEEVISWGVPVSTQHTSGKPF